MGLKNFMAKLLRPKWNGSPEMFLAVVMEMQLRNDGKYDAWEVRKWGEMLQKIVKIKFKPYRDFAELMEKGKPDASIVAKLKQGEQEVHQRRDLKQAIYGPDADLGDDDVLRSDSDGTLFARDMIKAMSAHVRFSDEDQREIDQF